MLCGYPNPCIKLHECLLMHKLGTRLTLLKELVIAIYMVVHAS